MLALDDRLHPRVMLPVLFGSKLGFSRILDIGFTLWRVLTVFTRSVITHSAESEPIWMKSGTLSTHRRGEGLALAYFGRDPQSSDNWGVW